MENLALWLGGSSIVAAIIVQLIKGFIKKVIAPRFGDLGVQVVLFIIALIIAGLGLWVKVLPENVLLTAGQIFAGAMLIYQILWKAIINEMILGKTK